MNSYVSILEGIIQHAGYAKLIASCLESDEEEAILKVKKYKDDLSKDENADLEDAFHHSMMFLWRYGDESAANKLRLIHQKTTSNQNIWKDIKRLFGR